MSEDHELKLRTEFSDEELVAHLCHCAPPELSAQIEQAVQVDENLAVQVALLGTLLGGDANALSEGADDSDDQGPDGPDRPPPEAGGNQTTAPLADAGGSTVGEPSLDERISALHQQGLSVKQIADRVGLTRTLVDLKIRKLSRP